MRWGHIYAGFSTIFKQQRKVSTHPLFSCDSWILQLMVLKHLHTIATFICSACLGCSISFTLPLSPPLIHMGFSGKYTPDFNILSSKARIIATNIWKKQKKIRSTAGKIYIYIYLFFPTGGSRIEKKYFVFQHIIFFSGLNCFQVLYF